VARPLVYFLPSEVTIHLPFGASASDLESLDEVGAT